MRRWLTSAIAILSVTTLLAGCGGDDQAATTAEPGTAAPVTATPVPPSNAAPTISGTPGGSVAVGQRYTFLPVASDPDGDVLGFTIENKPVWATFDTATGRLTGIPSATNVGTHSNIRIAATDTAHATALAPFAIQVTPQAVNGTGAATLSWVATTENTDGSPVQLAGYEVRYGASATLLDRTIKLSNPSVNTFVIDNLESGTWFFAVVAVSKQGVMSDQSNVASKTVG